MCVLLTVNLVESWEVVGSTYVRHNWWGLDLGSHVCRHVRRESSMTMLSLEISTGVSCITFLSRLRMGGFG